MDAPRKSGGLKWLFWLVIVPAAVFALYLWLVLTWSYSRGERAGYVQKLSERGWICKTWEGELALVTMPGTVAEKFFFSVRDPAVAQRINTSIGQRVTLDYEQHVGIPSRCFGDTEYFVSDVRIVGDPPGMNGSAPPAQPGAGAVAPSGTPATPASSAPAPPDAAAPVPGPAAPAAAPPAPAK